MSIKTDISQLGPLEIVEMFVLDVSDAKIAAPKTGPLRFFWHAGTKPIGIAPIVWSGYVPGIAVNTPITYEPYPVESDGWQATSTGKLPRPTLRVSNIGGQVGAFLRSIKDGLGAKVIRKRTLGKYLDATNFKGGNPYANPNAAFPDETYLRVPQGRRESDHGRDGTGRSLRRRGHHAAEAAGAGDDLSVGLSLARMHLRRTGGADG